MSHRRMKLIWGVGLVIAGLVAGVILTSSLDLKRPAPEPFQPASVTVAAASPQDR